MQDGNEDQYQDKAFTFIEYADARLPADPAVRNVIRRHAMRNVAETRRQRDKYGKHNLRQLPTSSRESNPEASSFAQSSSPEAVSVSHSHQIESHADAPTQAIIPITLKYAINPSASFPMSIPEATIVKNFAILHLIESLVGLHLGANAQSSPTLRLELHRPQLPHSKMLLSFIPSRYGQVSPLTHAVDCLVARLKQITLRDDGFSEDRILDVLCLYGKALKALQGAVDDEEARMTPETLCAAELLGFFELLDGSSRAANSWTRHAAGVAQLIQLQGADHFQTDFELALITAYVGPLVHEAFLNHRTCFLVDDGWKMVLREAICGNSSGLADDNNTVLSLWYHLIEGPNLFKEIAKMVLSPVPIPPNTIQSAIDGLMADLQKIHGWLGMDYDVFKTNDPPQSATGNFLAWQMNFRQSIISLQQQQHAGWPILQGACIMSWIVRARLLTALSPSRFHDLETVSQKLALDIKTWRTNSASLVNSGLLGGLFMRQTVCIARVNCETNAIWTEGWSVGAYGRNRKEGGMIERRRFETWCEAIGLQV